MGLDLSQINNRQAGGKSIKSERSSVNSSFLQKDILKQKSKFPDKKKEEFYSELRILLTSGLDLRGALEIIVEEQQNEKLKSIIEKVMDRIIHGESFSDAIEKQKIFSMYEYFSIKIGEESGRLPDVLEELTVFYRKKLKQKKQLVSAFSYPLLIFITAFAAVFFMMNFVVPLFADAFKRFNADLPALTRGVINFSVFFRDYWWTVPGFVGALVITYRSIKSHPAFKKYSGLALLKIPVLGEVIRKVYLARFCQTMALMTGARTPLVQALELVRKMIGLYPLEIALTEIKDDLFHGKTLHESMSRFPVFDAKIKSLVKVAEETNQLDVIFTQLYDQYSEEADHKISLFSSMLEPLLIVMIGGMVAVILISMYLPMFKLGNSLMGG